MMACPNPGVKNNKTKIEKLGCADNWEGKYISFGSVDYMSVAIGICVGVALTYGFYQFF